MEQGEYTLRTGPRDRLFRRRGQLLDAAPLDELGRTLEVRGPWQITTTSQRDSYAISNRLLATTATDPKAVRTHILDTNVPTSRIPLIRTVYFCAARNAAPLSEKIHANASDILQPCLTPTPFSKWFSQPVPLQRKPDSLARPAIMKKTSTRL